MARRVGQVALEIGFVLVEQVAAQVYYIERWIDGQLRKLLPGPAVELSYESVCRNPAAAIANTPGPHLRPPRR